MVIWKNNDITQGTALVDCPACKGGAAWMDRVDAARKRANLDAGMERQHFDNFEKEAQPEAHDAAIRFANKRRGVLYLGGSPGTGKTHLLAAIANYIIANAGDVLYAVTPRVISQFRNTRYQDEEAMRELRAYHTRLIDCGVLLLDELGAEDASDRAQSQLQEIIDYRYANRRPMAIASNLRRDQLPARMESRLRDKAWVVAIGLAGEDYRNRSLSQRATKDIWDE